MLKCKPNQVVYAKTGAIVRKTWNLKTWDGDIWMDDPQNFGSADALEHSEPSELSHSW